MRRKFFRAVTFFSISAAAVFSANSAKADLSTILTDGTVNGSLRLDDWGESNVYNTGVNANTAAFSGSLIGTSGSLYGFSATVGFYSAHGIDTYIPYMTLPSTITNERNPVNTTLGSNETVLGQAYLQWSGHGLSVRGGNIPLDTPFANAADYRMIPVTYQGVWADYDGLPNLDIQAARIFRFKDWISDSFTSQTSYIWNGIGVHTSGMWLVGGKYHSKFSGGENTAELWLYQFNQVASLVYGADNVIIPGAGKIAYDAGIQGGHEKSGDNGMLGRVNSNFFGTRIGVTDGGLNITGSFVHVFKKNGAFNDGGIADPYTNFYGSAELYTQNPLYDTASLGAGNAYQAAVTYALAPTPLSVGLTYNYFSMGTQSAWSNISEFSQSLGYNLSGFLHGLNLNNISSVGYGPGMNRFVEDRLMLEYDF